MKCHRLALLYLLTLGVSTNLYATRVMPEFSGYWYVGAGYIGMDACGLDTYQLGFRVPGSAASVAASWFDDDKVSPKRDDCIWNKPFQGGDMETMPADFPGTPDEWNNILRDGSNPRIIYWGRECKDQWGRVKDKRFIKVFPSYVCPAGSKRGIENGVAGCTTTPTACKADVVGRDLNLIGFGALGHIALAEPGATSDMVMEVLKTPSEGIFTNSMDSFEHFENNAYWGDKGGLSEKPLLMMSDANQIISAGIDQTKYPFEYTLTWDFHPGGMSTNYVLNNTTQHFDQILTVTSAKFRCDSFVYYTYLKGADLDVVPNFSFPDVPATLFNAFLTCRNDRGSKCGASMDKAMARDFLPEMSLESLLQKPSLDVNQLDKTMKSYLDNPGIARMSKINYLWALGQKYSDNENKLSYILDSLSILHPVELVPDLISAFRNTGNISTQRKIISTLLAALAQNDINILNKQMSNIIQAQNFIREVLLQNTHHELLKYVVQMYPSIVTPDQAEKDLELFFQRTDVPDLNRLLTTSEKYFLKLRMAFAAKDSQSPELIQLISDNGNDKLFMQSLCDVLNVIPAQWISSEAKQPLRAFLTTSKPNMLEENSRAALPFKWLNAYAAVSVTNDSQKNDFMLDYIRKENDEHARIRFLQSMPKSVYRKMSPAERMRYKSELRAQISVQPVSDAQKTSILQALSRFADE